MVPLVIAGFTVRSLAVRMLLVVEYGVEESGLVESDADGRAF